MQIKKPSITSRVRKAIKESGQKKVYVCYSAYKLDDNDEPIDNLDEIAFHGKAILTSDADEFFGGEKSKNYRSEVIENPTWLQVAVLANAMIRRTRDTHHCFLEGLSVVDKKGDVTILDFLMGS